MTASGRSREVHPLRSANCIRSSRNASIHRQLLSWNLLTTAVYYTAGNGSIVGVNNVGEQGAAIKVMAVEASCLKEIYRKHTDTLYIYMYVLLHYGSGNQWCHSMKGLLNHNKQNAPCSILL